jgi:hypothetical protein
MDKGIRSHSQPTCPGCPRPPDASLFIDEFATYCTFELATPSNLQQAFFCSFLATFITQNFATYLHKSYKYNTRLKYHETLQVKPSKVCSELQKDFAEENDGTGYGCGKGGN